MNTRILIVLLVLVFIHMMNESAKIIEKTRPDIAERYINPFIDKSYRFPVKEGMKVKWWVKYCTDDFARLSIFILTAWVLWPFSRKLSAMFIVYSVYHLFDHFMLWYNYKQSYWLYWVEGVCDLLCVLTLLIPERRGAKIKYFV